MSVANTLYSTNSYRVNISNELESNNIQLILNTKILNDMAVSNQEFKFIMANLKLPYPKFIEYAVPGNQQCGVCPDHLPENLEKYCGYMTHSIQG